MALMGAALALGAQSVATIVPFALFAIASGLFATRVAGFKVTYVAALFAGLTLLSLLQACPLPTPVVALVAPKNAEIWRGARNLLGENASWVPLSLQPAASVVEALKWAGYTGAAVAGSVLFTKRGARRVARLVFGSALVVAGVTLAHGLLRAERLYGFYQPSFDPGPWGLSPLLNPNNRAGYLNLGALCGLALLRSRRASVRVAVPIGVGFLVGTSVLAASRGGIAALAVALLAVSGVALSRRRHRQRLIAYVALAALLGGGLLAVIGAHSGAWDALRRESLQKLTILSWTKPMFRDFPLLGVGRGAFGSVFPAYRQGGGHVIYQYAENFIAQWAIEWGTPVALILVVCLLLLLFGRRARASGTYLKIGLGALLAQNFFDLALELTAVGMGFAVVAGALSPQLTLRFSYVFARRMRIAAGLTAAGLVALAAVVGRPMTLESRERLSARVGDASVSPRENAKLLVDIAAAVDRAPADPFLPLLGGIVASRIPGGTPLRWLGWSLERDPMAGRTHLAVADVLAARGASGQAIMHLRYALEREPGLGQAAAERAQKWAPNWDGVMRGVPDGPQGSRMLMALAGAPRWKAKRREILEEIVKRDPTLTRAQEELARLDLRDLRLGTPACAGARRGDCLDRVGKLAASIARLSPGDASGTILGAELLAVSGKLDEARALLSSQCNQFHDAEKCWSARITLSEGEERSREFDFAVRAYYATACDGADRCAAAASRIAAILQKRGDFLGAMEYFGRAARVHPTARSWLALAKAARAAGQPGRARQALARAAKAAESDAAMRDAIKREMAQ